MEISGCFVNQILREIKVDESRNSKSAILTLLGFYVKSFLENKRSFKTVVFAILGALNFVTLANFRIQKVQKFMKIKIQSM